jgi:spore coat protein U-like protein
MVLRIETGGLNRIFVCIVTGLLVLSSSVQAQTVTLDIQGTLEASCSLSGLPAGNLSLGDVNAAGSMPLNFSVDCNAPFAYALVSGNGALGRVGGVGPMAPGSLPIASSVPYTVTTNFTTDAGSFGDSALPASSLTVANAAPCIAATFSASCPFSNSGTGAAAAGLPASLSIAWTPPAVPLQAGTYQDTLTLTVRART